MLDICNSINCILLGIVILETAIIFGDWINKMASRREIIPMSKDPKSRFYGFVESDYFELFLGVSFLIIIIWFSIFYIFPLYIAVLNLMNTAGVPESLSYISLTFSFIAITLTIILNNWNYISNIFIKVSSRNRDNALHERLDDIEFALRRIERVSNFKESKKIVDNNPKYKKLSPVLISIIGIGIFLFVTSLIALTLFPNNSSDIAIAVTTGVISGFFILMFQKSILERV